MSRFFFGMWNGGFRAWMRDFGVMLSIFGYWIWDVGLGRYVMEIGFRILVGIWDFRLGIKQLGLGVWDFGLRKDEGLCS